MQSVKCPTCGAREPDADCLTSVAYCPLLDEGFIRRPGIAEIFDRFDRAVVERIEPDEVPA